MAVTIQSISRGTAPGDGTGDTAYDGTGKINTNFTNVKTELDKVLDITSDRLLGRDTVGAGDPEEITVGGGLEFTGSGGVQRSALTGDVTASAGSNATTIANSAVTLAKMADVATSTVFYRKTAATGAPEVQTLATLKTDLGLTGTNSGDQTITLTGDVTGSGTGSFATTIANNSVSLAMMEDVATGTVFYRKTAATGDPEVQTLATLKTDLGLTGTNSGDQTSMSGISDTKANFNSACSNGTFLYVGDVSSYTHPNHTGHVTSTGDGATVVTASAITGQTDIGAAIVGTDKLLISDGGAIRRTDVSRIATYCAANMSNVAVTGTITATGDITAFYTSDVALKQNIEPITSALDKVSRLNGSRFQYKKKEGTFYGLMAQDMREVLPELVHENADGELTIRMAGFELVALLVEAIKELKEKLDANSR